MADFHGNVIEFPKLNWKKIWEVTDWYEEIEDYGLPMPERWQEQLAYALWKAKGGEPEQCG